MDKSDHIRLSNWQAPQLTAEQQLYAMMDSYASVLIYNSIIKLIETNSKSFHTSSIILWIQKLVTRL